jgi:hypothetical protein
MRECGDGDGPPLARRRVGDRLQDGRAHTRIERVGGHRQVGGLDARASGQCGLRPLEAGQPPLDGERDAVHRHALRLPLGELALEQRDGNARFARSFERDGDALSRFIALGGRGAGGNQQDGDRPRCDQVLHHGSPPRACTRHPRVIERRAGDGFVTPLPCRWDARASRARSTRIFKALSDAPSRSAMASYERPSTCRSTKASRCWSGRAPARA